MDEGDPVNFSGYGFDPNGTIVAYFWRSSLDDTLSGEANFTTDNLSSGVHLIYFRVQNETGVWSEEMSKSLEVYGSSQLEVDDDLFGLPRNLVYGLVVLVLVAAGGGAYLRSRGGVTPVAGSATPPKTESTPETLKFAPTETVAIECPGCSHQMEIPKLSKLQSIKCDSCGLAGEIEI